MKRLNPAFLIASAGLALGVCSGCQQKTTRKVTVETPEKKVEIEVEKTKKD